MTGNRTPVPPHRPFRTLENTANKALGPEDLTRPHSFSDDMEGSLSARSAAEDDARVRLIWLTSPVKTSPDLAAHDVPRDVVAAAGAWLGAALESDGFQWMPTSLRLQRRLGTLRHQLHIQPSKYNRRGKLVKVSTILNVRDSTLSTWRTAHPDLVVNDGDFVCGHLLGYASGRANGYFYGSPEDGEIDLTDPLDREAQLQTFLAMLRNSVLPWYAEASEPELIVTSRAGDCTNDPVSIVEWLACRNRSDLITAYADRYRAHNPRADDAYFEGVAAARSAQLNPGRQMGNLATALGWTVTMLTKP